MPQFESIYFGSITFDERSVVRFPAGLPGFADEERFLPIEQPANQPMVFLQSLNRPDLCFITLPLLAICPDYRLAVPAEDLSTLGLARERQPAIGSEVACLGIVSVSENSPPTINLRAPLVINWRIGCAVQAIQADSPYSHMHPLVEPAVAPSCS